MGLGPTNHSIDKFYNNNCFDNNMSENSATTNQKTTDEIQD